MKPVSARVRMYRVGFGDCFLVSFVYSEKVRRHVLIDFGTTKAPEGQRNLMQDIAEDIRTETHGKLDVVVATHRHKDHISGFTTTKQRDGPGDVIRSLKPSVVLLPWTEDPDAAEDATKATKTSSARSLHVRALANMHEVAQSVSRLAARAGVPQALADRLAFLGEDNIKNVEAVRNLLTMSEDRRYLSYGKNAGLGRALPGVKVTVLGPPTLEDTDAIRRERADDDNEFWMLAAKSAATPAASARVPLFAESYRSKNLYQSEEVRWLAERLNRSHAEQMLGIVTVLDNAMNNTSLILLFEVNGKKLLFPGDAQIENWEYALSKPAVTKALATVDLYKVGHHGSRNATPKSLWNSFRRRSDDSRDPRRLKTLLSTEKGKHGNESQNTEVPRRTLVSALKTNSEFHTTESIRTRDEGPPFEDIEIAFS